MFWIPVFVWMGVIFYFSAQNGEESSGLSMKILESVLNFLGIHNANLEILGFLLRKAAHASIYFVLAMLIITAFIKSSKLAGMKVYVLTVLISFLYACTDELHQWFIPGRVAAFTDVLIDTCGAISAVVLFVIITKIYERFSKKKVIV